MFCYDDIKNDYDIYKTKFGTPMTFEEYYEYRIVLINEYDIYDDHNIYGGISIDCVFGS